MARREIVQYVDDLDGGQAEGRVLFGLDGVQYEIDLSAANAEQLRTIMASYIDAGRRVGGRRKNAGNTSVGVRSVDLDKVRTWARENGYQVSSRGRIAKDVQAAYDAAH